MPRPVETFRRFVLLSVTAVVVVGCSATRTATSPDAYSMNGATMSRNDFEEIAAGAVDSGVYSLSGTSIGGDDTRQLLNAVLQLEALRQFLPLVGEEITRADVDAGLAQSPQLADATGAFGDFLSEYLGINSVLDRVVAPGTATLRKWYEKSPVLSGSLCARHILVGTESEARDVMRALDAGMSFAEASHEYSIDDTADASDGALESANGACIPNTEVFAGGFDGDFLAGALSAKVGVATGPIKSQFGWHIVLNRPWSEVSDSVIRNLATRAGANLLVGFLGASKVSVASEYGTWSPSDIAVIAD